MANAVYDAYKTASMTLGANSGLDQNTVPDGPYCLLIDTGTYTFNQSHQFYSPSVTGVVSVEQRITAPTVAAGVFDGADTSFPTVSGVSVEALLIYRKNSGANTTWRLVVYLDTSISGLPIVPNGGDILVTWHATGIFKM